MMHSLLSGVKVHNATVVLLYYVLLSISEIGKQQFLEAGGLESLREFSYKSIFDDKRWDRLLNRACTVLCKVCQAKPLPVEVEMSPAKFNIPDGHLVMPEGKSFKIPLQNLKKLFPLQFLSGIKFRIDFERDHA